MNMAQKRERPAGTRANAEENTENAVIVDHPLIDHKSISTLRARAALLGYEAWISTFSDGRTTFAFRRHNQSRVFCHVHDVEAFFAQIGGAR